MNNLTKLGLALAVFGGIMCAISLARAEPSVVPYRGILTEMSKEQVDALDNQMEKSTQYCLLASILHASLDETTPADRWEIDIRSRDDVELRSLNVDGTRFVCNRHGNFKFKNGFLYGPIIE